MASAYKIGACKCSVWLANSRESNTRRTAHVSAEGSAQFRKQADPYMFSFSDLSSDVEALGCDVGCDVVAMSGCDAKLHCE